VEPNRNHGRRGDYRAAGRLAPSLLRRHFRYPTADEGLEILTGEAIDADIGNRTLDE
jgi:hypothetical protein